MLAGRRHRSSAHRVLERHELAPGSLETLLARYGVALTGVPSGEPIPGSYWGAPEAGIIAHRLYARADTPVHSVLHELGHYVCMGPVRRSGLHTNAGGGDDEEAAVCYIEVLLADELPGFGRSRCLDDMDSWGYSFREGSSRAWLEGDARDARAWLVAHGIVDTADRPTWRLRE